MKSLSRMTAIAASVAATAFGAQAADMSPPPAPAPAFKVPVVQVYDWTGPYLGINFGASVGRSRTRSNDTGAVNENEITYLSAIGAVGGGQVGYNWQVPSFFLNNLVLGVEADIQASGQRGSACLSGCLLDGTVTLNLQQKVDWFGTVRARAGLASGPVLSYVTGGLAYGHVGTSGSFVGFGPPPIPFALDGTRVGYTFGSGVEVALGGNWTAKLEYLYLNFGKSSTVVDTTPAAFIFGSPVTVTTETHDHIFRGGLNYRFGGGNPFTAPLASWSGLYIGGNGGSLVARNPSSYEVGGVAPPNRETFNLSPIGYLGGAQIGYLWQAGAWVFGVEADIQGTLAKDQDSCVLACTNGAGIVAFDQKVPFFGTVRGRVGYSVGATLFYATGGFAVGTTKTTISTAGFVLPSLQFAFTHRGTGYAVGAGIETPLQFAGLFGPGWTITNEYLYLDLGRSTDRLLSSFGSVDTFTTRTQAHIFRTGVNYHFNAPVAAKY